MKNRDICTAIVPRKPLAKQFERVSERRSQQNSPQTICPKCGSTDLKIGAGRKPGEESRRCDDCKTFLGYSPLAKLKTARRRKQLTESLEILENLGIQGELAIFSLSLIGADDFSNQANPQRFSDLGGGR